MPRQEDKKPTEDLERMNEELTRSLKLCHSILDDYRSKLAANSNELESASDGAATESEPA